MKSLKFFSLLLLSVSPMTQCYWASSKSINVKKDAETTKLTSKGIESTVLNLVNQYYYTLKKDTSMGFFRRFCNTYIYHSDHMCVRIFLSKDEDAYGSPSTMHIKNIFIPWSTSTSAKKTLPGVKKYIEKELPSKLNGLTLKEKGKASQRGLGLGFFGGYINFIPMLALFVQPHSCLFIADIVVPAEKYKLSLGEKIHEKSTTYPRISSE